MFELRHCTYSKMYCTVSTDKGRYLENLLVTFVVILLRLLFKPPMLTHTVCPHRGKTPSTHFHSKDFLNYIIQLSPLKGVAVQISKYCIATSAD
jgi:hypothetical protein